MRGFSTLLRYALKIEFANVGRIAAPLFFGLTLLVLFAFAFAGLPSEWLRVTMVGATTITAFMSLQLAFARAFDHDDQDQVVEYLKCYPLGGQAWFLAKFCHVLAVSAAAVIPIVLAGNLFFSTNATPTAPLTPALVGIWVATLGGVFVGLASIGVLLATLTLRAASRQILFPVLYFPLVAPILIAAIECAKILLSGGAMALAGPWLGLIGIFDVVYFALGLLFFDDLMKA